MRTAYSEHPIPGNLSPLIFRQVMPSYGLPLRIAVHGLPERGFRHGTAAVDWQALAAALLGRQYGWNAPTSERSRISATAGFPHQESEPASPAAVATLHPQTNSKN